MLLTEEEVNARLESPDNLINRLRRVTEKPTGLSIFGVPTVAKPSSCVSTPPPVENLVEDLERRIKTANIHEKALDLLSDSIDELKSRLPEVDSPKALASVAKDMGVIVKNIEQTENERRSLRTSSNKIEFVFYAPTILKESDFGPVIKVLE